MGRKSSAKRKILRTASNLFWHNGFESTSVGDILGETGLGSGTLYWFFDSKEELLSEVLESYLGKLESVLAAPALAKSEDPRERISLIFDFYRRQLIDYDFELGCPIGNIVLELGDRYPAVRIKTENLFTAWRNMITRCLQPAADRFRSGDEMDSLAMFVLTTMEGGVMQARAHKDIGYFDESVHHLMSYLDTIL